MSSYVLDLDYILLICFSVLQGMPGAPGMKMYSRDDLMSMKNLGDEDDDDEEDEDEAQVPFKLVG